MTHVFKRHARLLIACACLALLVVVGVAFWLSIPTPEERYQRGIAAYRSGELKTLQAEASALDDMAGYDAHAAVLAGLIELHDNRLREAIELFGTATEHPETRGTAYTFAGEAFYRLRRFDDARRALEEALKIDPKNVDAQRWLASSYYDLGLMTAALSSLRSLADLAPDDARPHRLAGLILKDFENYDEAIAAYRESLRRDPQQPDADQVRAELAESLIRLGRYDEAYDELKPARETPDVLRHRAEIAHARNEPERALEQLNQAMALAPDDPQVLLVLGRIQLESGNAAEAVETLRRAAAIDPVGYEIRQSLAQALRRLGREAEAEEQTQRMLALRELRSRFSSLHETAMISPNDAEVRYELGRIAIELGRPDLAFGWFAAALAIDRNHAGAREALAAIAAEGVPESGTR